MSSVATFTLPPSLASLAKITPALTTTFIPSETTCGENRLTMLANRKFEIWMNEPVPVAGSTYADCHPSEWLSSYTLLSARVTQPAFNPLVCPQNYWTIGMTSNYIACCPSGYSLASPSSTPFPDRPAFGGTCYTPIEMATPVLVTAYGTAGPTRTFMFSATATNAQAYAHPYEGFAIEGAEAPFIIPNPSSAAPTHSTTAGTDIRNSTSVNVVDKGKSEPSTPVKIAIVLSISIPCLILSALLGFWLSRRRAHSTSAQSVDTPKSAKMREYYPADNKFTTGHIAEIWSGGRGNSRHGGGQPPREDRPPREDPKPIVPPKNNDTSETAMPRKITITRFERVMKPKVEPVELPANEEVYVVSPVSPAKTNF